MKKFVSVFLFAGFASLMHAAQTDSLSTTPLQCIDKIPIASIEFDGLEYTKVHVVWRELVHKVGGVFSQKTFETEKRRLEDLDLFTEISVTCEPAERSQEIDSISSCNDEQGDSLSSLPSTTLRHTQCMGSGQASRLSSKITYHFKEIFRWIPAPAVKPNDRDGFYLGLALANLNVHGEDIRAELQYRTAVKSIFEKNEYAFYVSSPYLYGIPLSWNFEFLRTDSWDDVRGFQDASWLFSLDVNWKLYSHFALLGKTAYRYLEGGPGHLPEFGFGMAVDYRDSELDSRKGIYFESAITHVGVGGVRGENYVEFLEDGRAYYTFGNFVTGASALFRLRPGDVKRYDYFYHGGLNSFRGHGPDSAYVGVHEALLTLEERFVLLERRSASLWGVNFFYGVQLVAGLDGRLLWDEGCPGWKNYEGAVYGGVHLIVPALGRIRFEVGYSPDNGKVFYDIGFFDKTTSSRWRSR